MPVLVGAAVNAFAEKANKENRRPASRKRNAKRWQRARAKDQENTSDGLSFELRPRPALGVKNLSTGAGDNCWWDLPASPITRCDTPTTRASDSSPIALQPEPRRTESKLAAFLRDDGMYDKFDVVTHQLVDDVVATMKRQEQMHSASLKGLQRNVNLEHRRKIVAWFVQAFHVVCFDDSILYGVVNLADRYVAACSKTVIGSELQGTVMACLCTTLKLETADFLPYSIPELIAHITRHQVSVQQVAQVEREVLTTLDFAVTTPTIANFMDIFALRTSRMARVDPTAWDGFSEGPKIETVVGGPSSRKPRFWILADFLCQLGLINERLAARKPSLLSASALILSLHALEASPKQMQVLLEDVGLVWDLRDARQHSEVTSTVRELLEEWTSPVDAGSARTVQDKFAERGLADLACFRLPATVSFPSSLRAAWERPAWISV